MSDYPGAIKNLGIVCGISETLSVVVGAAGAIGAVYTGNSNVANISTGMIATGLGAAAGGATLVEKGYQIENNQREKQLCYEERKQELQRK